MPNPINPINQYKNKTGHYPGNNKQWWVARADADEENGVKQGDFKPEVLQKLFMGNNRAPQGHYLLYAFDKDRTKVSGIADLPKETVTERPASCAFFGGRVFWGVNSTVYYSQLLTGRQKAGLCYQVADPTAENLSDLVATDGGVIPIPEISQIVRLVTHDASVLVF